MAEDCWARFALPNGPMSIEGNWQRDVQLEYHLRLLERCRRPVYFRTVLPVALADFRHVLVMTHVPPFKEACWHEGKISADDWLPHFACRAVGEVLREAMRLRPERQMTVLCGHTHSSGQTRILPNPQVKTGGAECGSPAVQEVIG